MVTISGLTPAQLGALLEAVPGPAQIIDAGKTVVAGNRAATGLVPDGGTNGNDHGAPDSHRREGECRKSDLGAGWTLCRWNSPTTDIQSLASGIAHEIRNPLSAILTAVKLVQDDAGLGEETTLLLDIIKKESMRMNRIVTEFSSYVKPPRIQLLAFDLAATVRDTTSMMQLDGNLAKEVQIEDRLPVSLVVSGDEPQLTDALRRVLQNAADAMPAGGTLTLASTSNGGGTCLTVADTGAGLSEESLRRAFQPFYSRRSQGIGLGLAIARAAIEASGGSICIENLTARAAVVAPPDSTAIAGTAQDENGHKISPVDKPAGALVTITLPHETAPT